MLTKEEAHAIKIMLKDWPDKPGGFGSNAVQTLSEAIDRVTDTYAPGQGTDVIAKGPDMSTRQMLDELARILGWRTDFATGDSPITWDLVKDEVRKLARVKPVHKNFMIQLEAAAKMKIDMSTCILCQGQLVLERTLSKTTATYRCNNCKAEVLVG